MVLGPALGLALSSELKRDVAIRFDLPAFVWPNVVSSQQVQVYLDDAKIVDWIFEASTARRSILIKSSQFLPSRMITLTFSIPTCAKPSTFGVSPTIENWGLDSLESPGSRSSRILHRS
jgi:hypothetical protein